MPRANRASRPRAPSACPVCQDELHTTRLACATCGTEVGGAFSPCAFCRLDADDLGVLAVFLRSRGNVKELERFLGVSYPTARARLDGVIERLGLTERPKARAARAAAPRADSLDVLRAVADGSLEVGDALDRLR